VLLLQPALRVSRRPPLGLTSLALSKNLLGDAGAVALAHALRDHRTLQGLNLSVNAIGDRGALALADTLAGIRCFRRLVLRVRRGSRSRSRSRTTADTRMMPSRTISDTRELARYSMHYCDLKPSAS